MKKQKHTSTHHPLNGSGLVHGKKPGAEVHLTMDELGLNGFPQASQIKFGTMVYVPSILQLWSLVENGRSQGGGSSQCCRRPSPFLKR